MCTQNASLSIFTSPGDASGRRELARPAPRTTRSSFGPFENGSGGRERRAGRCGAVEGRERRRHAVRGVLNDRLPWIERRPDDAEGAGRRSTREALAARETDGSQTPITTREHARSRELGAPAPLQGPLRLILTLRS